MCRFSIIIPCYNVMKYLEACVESVEAQAFKDYEILLINDGSTDATGDIAVKLSEKYSNIRYFEKANGGLSHTRNYGIDRAEGEYLYFLDSDDMLDEDALAKTDDCIKRNNIPDVVVTRYRELDDRSGAFGERTVFPLGLDKLETAVEKYRFCYLKNDIKPMSVIYIVRREYILSKGLYFKEKIVHEDELWTPQVFLNSKSICFLDESCYIYRINRAGSIMNKITEKNIYDRLRIIAELEILADKQPEYAEMYKSRCACMLNGILGLDIDIKDEAIRKQIEAKMCLLKDKIQKKYILVYTAYRMLGLGNTMKLVRKLKNRQ